MDHNNKVRNSKYDEVYGLDYFYENYSKKYDPSLLGLKGKRPVKISKLLYRKIFMEYLDVYFKEVYYLEDKTYFLYTGMFKKVLYRPRVIKNVIKKIVGSSIGFFWYNRPSYLLYYNVRFEKLTGSTNKLPAIEKTFKKGFDINLIANFETVINEFSKKKLLFLK